MGRGGKIAILFIFAILFSFATTSSAQIVFAEHNPNHNPNENSNKVLTGAGPPPPKLGNIDDFYIDSSGEFATYYVKTAQGWQGPLALRGEQGPQGEQGEQGPQGEQGEQGPQGEKGETGEQGPPGLDGQNCTAVDHPEGVEIVCTDPNTGTIVIREILKDGNEGKQGPQGEQGEQGDPGHNSLTVVTNEPPGQNCEEGGIKVESGVDDDNDGVLDQEEIDFTGFVCKMTGPQGPEGPEGPQGPPPVADTLDTDGDGIPNATDPDDDNDGVDDISDVAPFNRTICSDIDHDWCDDCSSGRFDPNNDGVDTDEDGVCNVGDPDDDNDGIPDVFDSSPVSPVGACEIGQLLKWTGTGWSCSDDNVNDADSDPTNELQDIPSSGISCENQLAIAAAIPAFTPDTVCLGDQVCGDGIVSGTETCDDGNTVNGDGCSSACNLETLACQNGVFDESTQSCICDEGFFGELCDLQSPGPGGACSLDEASALEACVNDCFESPEDDLTCSQNCLDLLSPACQQATTTLLLCGLSEGCLNVGGTFDELTSCSQLACPGEFIDVFGSLECQNGVYDSFTETCFCDPGFGGVLCQTQALACENGTFDFGLERCVCVDGFAGELCEIPVPEDGTPCEDGNACTVGDIIIEGQCVGGETLSCGPGEECDPATGICLVSSGEICSDGIDNDSDGLVDCQDPDCGGSIECSAICDDGNPCTFDFFDERLGACVNDPNAVDGQACDDGQFCSSGDVCEGGQCVGGSPTCSEPFTCDEALSTCECAGGPIELVCTDGIDNDCDGLVDAQDSDCGVSADLAVTCSLPVISTMSSTDPNEIGTASGGYGCGTPLVIPDQDGPDDVYSFTCQQDGPVTFVVTDMDCDLDLYVLTNPNDPANTCVEGSTNEFSPTDSVTFDCAVGTTYYIVIEGIGFLSSGPGSCADVTGYALSFDVGAGSGCAEDCDNGADDDLDGLIDCNDTSCSEDPVCVITDADNDGFDSVEFGGADCDDNNSSVNPRATEVCDGFDNDCNEVIDDGDVCSAPVCGDGTINDVAGEQCDDGDLNNNNDCTNTCEVPFCGDGIIWNQGSGTELCDDGNNVDGDGCSSSCELEANAFRFTDLDLRDPHIFLDFGLGGCSDVTDSSIFGISSVNEELQNSILLDNDGDGRLDFSPMLIFRPLDQTSPSGVLDVAEGICSSPIAGTVCDLDTIHGSTAFTNLNSGTCLGVIPGTTSTYSPGVAETIAPAQCFVNDSFAFSLQLAGVTVPLTDVQAAATYDGSPASSLRNGLLRGFLSETVADTTIIPSTVPVVGGKPLSVLFPGGEDNCHSQDDRDDFDHDRILDGWWFYFNYDATQVTYVGP